MIHIAFEQPEESGAVETLLDTAFGPNRLVKSSYRYREGVERIWPLCLTARDDDRLVGTIRYWPITVGARRSPALLLGPVATSPDYRSQGLGARLIRTSLADAAASGHNLVILVGDAAYYQRFGFTEAARFDIAMPREAVARVLALPLNQAATMPSGLVRPWRGHRRLAIAA